MRVARSPPRKRGPGRGRLRASAGVVVLVPAGAAALLENPTPGIRWRKRRALVGWPPGRRTQERGRAGGWEGRRMCVWGGGGVPGEPPGCRGPGGGRCRVWRGAPRTRRAEAPRAARRPSASRPNALSLVLSPARPPARPGAAAGRDSKMKLWDVVAVCLVLLHTASAFPLPAGKRPPEAPAEDRSLGRRRAPFAPSSDCKNRSLPAGVTPPAARTHPKSAPTAVWPPDPGQSRAGADAPSRFVATDWCPRTPTPSLYVARAGFAPHRGNTCFCYSFSVPRNSCFPQQYHHHHRRRTRSCPLSSASPSHIYTPPFFSSKALFLWVCLAVLNSPS